MIYSFQFADTAPLGMAYSDENAERIETVRKCVGLIYSTLCPLFWVLWWCFFVYIDPSKCSELEYASTNNITGEVNRGGSKERCRSNGVFYGCFVGLFCAMATWLVFYALSFFVFICYIYIQIKSELPQSLTLLRTGRMGIFCSMLQDTRLRDEGLPVYPPCICMPICLCVYFHTKIYNRENICDTQSMEDKAFDWCCPDPKDPPTMADRCRYYLLPPEWCRYYLLLFFYLPYYIYVFIYIIAIVIILVRTQVTSARPAPSGRRTTGRLSWILIAQSSCMIQTANRYCAPQK